jgi:GTPase SAR1 family protein
MQFISILTSQTAGVDVVVAQVPIPDTTLIAELYMLDTSGSELYRESISQYWNGVYYAMVVFDVTNSDSFESCKVWMDELKKMR